MSTTDRIKSIVANLLCVEAERVTDTASLIDDLGADDLNTFELALELEDEFDIEINDEEIENVSTVGDLIKLVEGKL